MARVVKVGPMAVVALAAVISLLSGQAASQSNCMSVIISLAPCLNFVTGTSSTPTSQCCSQLASVVQSNPRCLCTVLNGGGASLGVKINQTLALALPGACNVETPPVSRCNAGSGPAMAPNFAPEGSPQASPRSDDTTSDPSITGGSKASSSSTSNANAMKASVSFIFLTLTVASWVSPGLLI